MPDEGIEQIDERGTGGVVAGVDSEARESPLTPFAGPHIFPPDPATGRLDEVAGARGWGWRAKDMAKRAGSAATRRGPQRGLAAPAPEAGVMMGTTPGPVWVALAAAEAHLRAGRATQAEEAAGTAIARDPASAHGHRLLGVARALRGVGGDVEPLARAAALEPEHAETRDNLGRALTRAGRWAEAEAEFRAAIRLDPEAAGPRHELAALLCQAGRPAEAEAGFRAALRRRPDFPEAHRNLGLTLAILGRHDEARAVIRRLVEDHPEEVAARLARIFLRLQDGDWRETAALDEELARRSPTPPHPTPAWDGTDPAGRTILLRSEDGTGDLFLHLGLLGTLRARGARVALSCATALHPLLRGCAAIDVLTDDPAWPGCDAWARLRRLPALLGVAPDAMPARPATLVADAALVDRWPDRLAATGGLRVGIHWVGNPAFVRDRFRSIPLAEFAPLAAVPGVRLVSLQVGANASQARGAGFPVFEPEGLDAGGPAFAETAALLGSLDLVVACDSAVAHLAGVLGRPTWLALDTYPHWYWLLGRADTPWYPGHRLWRQDSPGAWGPVFARMADELRRWVACGSPS